MGKVTVVIESDAVDDDQLREEVQGWIDRAYELNQDQLTIRMVEEGAPGGQ